MVNVGIAGCGYWGVKHIRVLHELAGANLTMVCDLNEVRLPDIRSRYPQVATTSDFRALLDSNVDAVVIATPVNSHFELAREAMLNGKHVLVEKPITASRREALELIELAESRALDALNGHHLLVGTTERVGEPLEVLELFLAELNDWCTH